MKVKGIKVDALTKKQQNVLKKHSKHHTVKHIRSMVTAMRGGATFKQSHNIAMKKVGK